MPKIVQFHIAPGGNVVELADNNSTALEIEGVDAKDYIVIDTTDNNEKMTLKAGGSSSQEVVIDKNGNLAGAATSHFKLFARGATDTQPTIVPYADRTTTGLGSAGADALSLIAGGVEVARCVTTNSDAEFLMADEVGFISDPDCMMRRKTGNSLEFRMAGTDIFGIDANGAYLENGNLGVGTLSPVHKAHVQDGDSAVVTNSADAVAKSLIFTKSRNATDGDHTIVQDGDALGLITFKGSDGNSFAEGARIEAKCDGTPGDGDFPTQLNFYTTPDASETTVLNARIEPNGDFGVRKLKGISGVASDLHVSGAGAAGDLKINNGDGRDVIIYNGSSTQVAKFDASAALLQLTGPGGSTGDAANTGAAAPTLYLESSTGNSQDRCALQMNADGNSGCMIDMYYSGNRKMVIVAQDAEQSITAEDTLVIKSESDDATRISVGASNFNVQDLATIHAKNSADAVGASYEFRKSRHTGDGSHTVVNDDDNLGTIKFTGSDGDSYQEAGRIEVNVDGTPGGCLGVSTDFSSGVGAGYSTGTGVATSTTSGGGSGATVNINSVNGSGAITSLSVNALGSGYDTGDTFTVNGGSSLATCTVISGTPGQITLSTTAGSSAQIHGANGGPVVRLLIDDQGIPYSRTDTASLWNFTRYNSATPTSYGEFRTNAGGIFLHSAQAGNSSISGLMFNYVERFRFTNADGFHILNGYSAPSSSVTDGVKLYAEDVSSSSELKVRDEAGNITTLSPHNFSVAERSDPMAWSHYSKNPFVGKEINVDMLAVIKAVEQLSGQSFIQERDLDPSECRDWDTEEQARVAKSQEAIEEWEQNTDEDKTKIPRPELYEAQPKPDWMN